MIKINECIQSNNYILYENFDAIEFCLLIFSAKQIIELLLLEEYCEIHNTISRLKGTIHQQQSPH